MLFVRNPTGVSHSPGEHAEIADCLVGVSALADTLERLADGELGVPPGAGLGRRRRPRRRAGEIEDGRFTAVDAGADSPVDGVRAGIVGRPGKPAARRPHPPRPRQLPQPRVPPGAAGADPARAGDVLDLARADVRRGRAARPGHLLRAGAGDLPRDGRGRDHDRRGVPLPPPPARRHAVRRPERDGPRAGRGGRARPGSGSRCSTPATCQQRVRRAARGRRRCATATATRSRWAERRSRADRARRRRRRRDPLRPRGAARPARDGRRGGRSGRPLHVHLSEQVAENEACLAAYGVTPTQLLARRTALLGPRTTAVHATHLTDADIAPPRRAPAPTPASARPPSATSATASARPAAARRRQPRSPSAATATRSSTRSRRCARSSWTSGWPPSSAATGPPPSCSPPATGATTASASTTPARSRSASAPTWSPSTPPARAPPAPAPTRTPPSSRPPPPTSPTWSSTAGSSSRAGRPRARSAASWTRPRSGGCMP